MVWNTRSRVRALREVIASFRGRYSILSESEAKQIAEAYEELAEIQKKCLHSYEEVVAFTSVSTVCTTCGTEQAPGGRRP